MSLNVSPALLKTVMLYSVLFCCSLTFCQEERSVPLLNPGFTDGLDGWMVSKFATMITADDAAGRTAGSAAKISDPQGQSMPFLAQKVPNLLGGATYAFRAWVRGEGNGSGTAAALKIEGYTEEGENPLGKYGRLALGKNSDWQRIEVVAEFPPHVNRATILLRLFGTGTIWFDDVEFVQTQPPPAITLYPERSLLHPGERSLVLRAGILSSQDDLAPPIGIVLRDATGRKRELGIETAREEAGRWQVTLTLPELVPGTYRLDPNVAGEPGKRAYIFVPLSERKPTNLTATGTLLANGKPFFPIGVYHCSSANYPMLAVAGFNCVQGGGPANLERFGASLDAAAKVGIMVDVPLYAKGMVAANMDASLAGIERYADHPAVLCWKIIDEPSARPAIVAEVPDAYARLRAADPNHPIELTLCSPPEFGYWANFCDLLQVDPYPIPRYPLTMVSDWVDTAVKGLQPWQNLTAVLQSGWSQTPFNQPSKEQARCMVYLALIHGAKGIFWYSFRDPNWRLEETPLWQDFPAINAETLALSRPVMLGTPASEIRVVQPQDAIHWRAWQVEGKTWLLLTNPGNEDASATISIGPLTSIRKLGETDATNVEKKGFEIVLRPVTSQTYLLTTP